MPSSTDAIIAARRRISSWLPACSDFSTACDFSPRFSPKASAHAGFDFTTSSGGSMFGRRGNSAPR